MKLPNFFILGAPKCGTTSLARWLDDHERIYLSPFKEPFYFSEDVLKKIETWEQYQTLFEEAHDDHIAVGEATTVYLFSKTAVQHIEKTFEDPLYIVMVRNPVDMAYSLHEQQFYCLNEDLEDFEKAWRLSPERRAGKSVPPECKSAILLDYQAFCLLGDQIERLYSLVPQSRVLVITLDDIKLDPLKEYKRAIQYLGVPYDGREAFPAYNQAKKWRNRWQGRLVRKISAMISSLKHKKLFRKIPSLGFVDLLKSKTLVYQKRPPMSDDFREELKNYYRADVAKLSDLLGRDFLTLWKF